MKPRSRSTSVRPAIKERVTKRARVRQFCIERGWETIGEAEWNQLRAAVPDISESTIRAGAGLPVGQPWLGVVQHSPDELENSLRDLGVVYETRPDLRRYCRDQVIAAKERARRLVATKPWKADMVEWMLVWLDDPAMFPAWIQVRRRQI